MNQCILCKTTESDAWYECIDGKDIQEGTYCRKCYREIEGIITIESLTKWEVFKLKLNWWFVSKFSNPTLVGCPDRTKQVI